MSRKEVDDQFRRIEGWKPPKKHVRIKPKRPIPDIEELIRVKLMAVEASFVLAIEVAKKYDYSLLARELINMRERVKELREGF